MKVAVLGVLSKPISANASGGTEVFCALLASGLAAQGHEVTLLAPEGTTLPQVKTLVTTPKTTSALRDLYEQKYTEAFDRANIPALDAMQAARSVEVLIQHQHEFDVVHDNLSSPIVAALSDWIDIPIVTTMHMPPTYPYVRLPFISSTPKNHYIAISDWQKSQAPFVYDRIYNGIDISNLLFGENGSEELIWIGRVSQSAPKGLKEALLVTGELQRPFAFSGSITSQDYYDHEIRPHIHSRVLEVGALTSATQKAQFLANAKAALFPIQWEEPFGFVFVEAMACGTPVIAFARGAVPEIVVDGVTGFIVNPSDTDIRGEFMVKKTGLEGIKEAVERLYALSESDYKTMRQACRRRVEEKFTVDRMVEGYVTVYKALGTAIHTG